MDDKQSHCWNPRDRRQPIRTPGILPLKDAVLPLWIRRKKMANERSETSSGLESAAQARTQSAATLAHSQKEKEAQQPIYLDSAEGFRRLEESDRRSFVMLGMFFLSQETQTAGEAGGGEASAGRAGGGSDR